MNNEFKQTGRQHIINININNDYYVYADISNNKKNNIINMSEIDDCINNSTNNSIPIKQYNSNELDDIVTNGNINELDNVVNDGNSNEQNQPIIDKKILREKIKLLTKNECIIIFNMIKKNTNKYTENSNGIFINMDYLDNGTLIKINTYVNKITQNKLNTDMIVVEDGISTVTNETDHNQSNIKLSNYEKAIIKRNHYMIEQKTFKNNNSWFVKKDSDE